MAVLGVGVAAKSSELGKAVIRIMGFPGAADRISETRCRTRFSNSTLFTEPRMFTPSSSVAKSHASQFAKYRATAASQKQDPHMPLFNTSTFKCLAAWWTYPGAVFVMDLGYGHGFLTGLKLLEGSANPMKGNFGFADVRYDAGTGGGKIDVNDTTHTISWWRADSYAKVRNGSFGALNQCAVLKNVYFSKNVTFNGDTVDFYSVVSGPYFMEFQFRNNKFRSYGTGARLP